MDYATSDGTATAGEDYAAASGTLTFAAGDTSKTVAVTVTDDAADELGETLALTLSNASGAAIADATATGTIEDDDRPLVSVSDAGGPEGGSAAFEVTLDVAPAAEVSAYYTTVDGTATAGADYTGRWGTLRFAAGETAKTVAVDLLEDEEEEPDETFRLELTWASGVGLADPTGIGTIEGDEGTEDLTASVSRRCRTGTTARRSPWGSSSRRRSTTSASPGCATRSSRRRAARWSAPRGGTRRRTWRGTSRSSRRRRAGT